MKITCPFCLGFWLLVGLALAAIFGAVKIG